MSKYRIILVDDHWIVRQGLKLIFETEEDYEVVAEAGDGKEALELIENIKADIVLLDLLMPGMSGVEFMKVYKEKGLSIPIVILTTLNEQDYIQQCIQLGAKGYLLKDTEREQLLRTVASAVRGELLLTEPIARQLFAAKEGPIEEDVKTVMEALDYGISERELVVLNAIARGETSKAISIDMEISERTVKAHLTKIYAKLGVTSRAEAVAKALSSGVIQK